MAFRLWRSGVRICLLALHVIEYRDVAYAETSFIASIDLTTSRYTLSTMLAEASDPTINVRKGSNRVLRTRTYGNGATGVHQKLTSFDR